MPDQTLLDAFAVVIDEAPPSRVTVDRAIADGRRILRTRRVATGSGAFIAVLAVALIAATVSLRTHDTPVVPRPTPDPTTSAIPRPPVPVHDGNVVTLPSGSEISLGAPSVNVGDVYQTPDGFVFTAVDSGVWFQSSSGVAERITTAETLAITPDGKAVVVSGVANDPFRVAAYELPSLRQIRQTRYTSGSMSAHVLAARGDWALIQAFNGGPGPGAAEVWNYRTGAKQPLAASDRAWAVDLTADGRVFRGMDNGSKQSSVDTTQTCFKLAAPNDPSSGGWCISHMTDGVPDDMQLSPSGTWLITGASAGSIIVRKMQDVAAGRSTATEVPVPGGGVAVFWEDDTRLVAHSVDGGRWYECRVGAACRPLNLQLLPGNQQPIRVYG